MGDSDTQGHTKEIVACPDLPVFEIGAVPSVCQRIVPAGKTISVTCRGIDPVQFACPSVFDTEAKVR